jgi:hypothetical protein
LSNQRTTFAKRAREQKRNDKLKAKQERLAARRANPNGEKGPPIAWDAPGGEAGQTDGTGDVTDPSASPSDDSGDHADTPE